MPALLPAVAWCADPQPAALPATNPAVNPMDRASGGKILVMPFVAVNPNDTNPWVGKSVQQSLVADLTAAAPDRVISTDQTAPTADAALVIARDAGARFLVAGGFITSGADLRITGQVLDVETGQPLIGLKATGESGQVFHMEDALANQVKAGLLRDPRDVTKREVAQEQVVVPEQPPVPSTGVRTDGEAAPPPAGTYSPYAFATSPNDAYASDYSRYVFSSPSAIYYNSYYSPYYYAPYYPYYGARGCSFLGSPLYGCSFPFSTGLGFSFISGGNWCRNGFISEGHSRDHRDERHEGRTGGRSVITNASIDASRFDRGSVNGVTVTRGFNTTGTQSIAGNTDAAPRGFARDGATRFQSTNFNAGASGSAAGINRTPAPPAFAGRGYDGPRGGDSPRAASVRGGNGGSNGSANSSRSSSGSNGGGGGSGHH